MGRSWWVGVSVVCAVIARPALAQYGRGYDPCEPPAMSNNAIMALASAIGQASRDRACQAERRAQWEAYNAKQKAAKDEADAAAARQREQQAQADRHREEAAHQQAAVQAHARQLQAAGQARAQHAKQARMAQAQRDTQAAEQRHRLDYVALVRAENEPSNQCRKPELARAVMEAWNGLDTMRTAGVKTIDIEHLTTVSFSPSDRGVTCHGVFVTDHGWKIAGTATVRKNVAGDPMFVWERDASQDLSAYEPPSATTAASPEMAREVRVEQSVAPSSVQVRPASMMEPLSKF